MINTPTPIEQSDPELGELLKEHCNSGFKNSLGVLSGRFQSQSLARISKELN